MARNNPSAEEVFRKNSEEMSDMERMMAEIMREKDVVPETEEEEAFTGNVDDIIDEVYTAPVAPAPPSRRARAPQNDGMPKAKSVSYDREMDAEASADAYSRALKQEKQKKREKESKKKGIRPSAVILILCALLVIGAILIKALSEDFAASIPGSHGSAEVVPLENTADSGSAPDSPEATLSPDIFIPTPDPEGENVKIAEPGSIVIMSDHTDDAQEQNASGEQPAAPAEHGYRFVVEDVSWTQARDRCSQMGGHLVNISGEAELAEVIALAEENGIEKLWIGCHRENAQLIWENDEQVTYYKWGRGEPSGYDSGDRVTEDFVLLWKFNGEWVYNDSRDDPVRDYPDMYSGQIGYVCEFEAQDGAQTGLVPIEDPASVFNFEDIQPDIPG